MRAYKIILIIVLAFVLLVMTLGAINMYTTNGHNTDIIIILIITLAGIVAGVLAMWYHIVSFRFYRKSKQQLAPRKIHNIIWIGAIASGVYYTLLGILSFIGNVIAGTTAASSVRSVNIIVIVGLLVIVLHGIFSLLEISILSKRMKKHREAFNVQNEIEEIGS